MKTKILGCFAIGLLLSSCAAEFNRVYKSTDYDYKYEYAKESFARGKYNQAISLLQELVTIKKGSDDAEECLYMLAMASYCSRDYESAATTFKKYFSSYPRGIYAEQASYYVGQSLYESTPEPRLDQTPTIGAINAYQQFLDYFPDSKMKSAAQDRLFELQDKLVTKEYLSAKLYYNLGTYTGNGRNGNYGACILTAENAIKDYPYTSRREEFAILILRAKFALARLSVEEKKEERYHNAIDEYYGFVTEYPESKYLKEAQDLFDKARKYVTTEEGQ